MKRKLITLLIGVIMLTQTGYAMVESTDVDTNPDSYHCQWVEQSSYPALQPLEITTVWVKFKNTGTATWYNYGDHPIRLGTSHDQDRTSNFYKHTWISDNRASNLVESSVAPGETGKFEFYIKAPETAKNYQEYFQPVVEGITWMEDWGVYWDINVSGEQATENNDNNQNYDDQNGYHAIFESQEPAENLTLAPGEIKLLTVKFKNTGSATWSNSGANPVHLGTDSAKDRQSLFFKHTWLSTNRAANLQENTVYSGQSGTFQFYIQAPTTSGKYTEYFTPVAENLTWIGENGVYWVITVSGDSTNTNDDSSSTDFSLTGSVSNNNAYLNWAKYTDTIQNSSSTISGYKVVRSETSSQPTYPDDWWVYLSDPNTTSYTDTSVQAGHSYYYRIGAYNGSVIAYTNSIYIKYTGSSSSSTDFALEVTSKSNGIYLSWDKTDNDNAIGYKVVRSTSDSSPTYPDDYLVYISGVDNQSYTDKSVEDGQIYYYRIGAYDGEGILEYTSSKSIEFTGTTSLDDSDFTLKSTTTADGIKLTWTAYDNDDIAGYKVLRSETDSSPTYPDEYYKYISGSESIGYVDTSVKTNHTYYYRIGAYDGNDVIAYSNTKKVSY